ncbi:MAG: hypothetical protein GY940_38375 [bacterium]|nr:hypothetical protein [bacterium]
MKNKNTSILPFNKNDIEDILALTPVQEGMLFHSLKDPEAGQYLEQCD